jgi:hypothetical protein
LIRKFFLKLVRLMKYDAPYDKTATLTVEQIINPKRDIQIKGI